MNNTDTNTGRRNTGHDNTGNRNTGHDNTGHRNAGHWNTGHWNTGNCNTGDCNTGHDNTGNRNTGHDNTGHRNAGHWNTGRYNTGHANTGNRNTGHWNTGNWNTGFFNTTTPDTVTVFNTHAVNREAFLDACPDWFRDVDPVVVLDDVPIARSMHEAWAAAWDAVDDKAAAELQVRALPGFDYDVWVEITGITFEPAPPEYVVVDGHQYRLVTEAADE